MKNIILFVIACTCYSFMFGQTGHTAYIKSKLIVYYVHDLSRPMPAKGSEDFNKMRVNLDEIARTGSTSGNFWSTPTNEGLKKLFLRLLRPYKQEGDRRLQVMIRGVLAITDKPVVVFLYNDYSGKTPIHYSWLKKGILCRMKDKGSDPATRRSWPCANRLPTEPHLAGHIGIGSYFFNSTTPVGYRTAEEKAGVFIHELVHTQLDSPMESTLGSISPYGNGGHSTNELIPSQNWAFNEGIATAFALRYHFMNGMDVTSWLNANIPLFVDSPTLGCSSSSSSAHCLEARLKSDRVPFSNGELKKFYKIRDIPLHRIAHNENIFANICYQYMKQFWSTGIMVNNLRRTAPSFSSTTNSFGKVFREMVRSASTYKHPNKPSGVRSEGQYVPLAILDYYVGYKLNNKAALDTFLGTKWTTSDANIDAYFSKKRPVLLGFRPNPLHWDESQLYKFSEYVRIHKPRHSIPIPSGR